MNDQSLPPPLVPSHVDLSGYGFMPLHGHRLFGSDFNATCTDSEWRAGVTLWWAAWNQVPAGSLPDNDGALARLADLGRDVKGWQRLRDHALHGFIRCSDGRLYHPVLAKLALEAWDRRVRDRERKARWRAGRDGDRDASTDDHGDDRETGTETGTPCVTERGHRRDVTAEAKRSEVKRSEPGGITPPPPPGSPREAGADAPAPPGGERRRITGLRPAEVAKAVSVGDLVALVRAFGGSSPASPEWIRDAAGMQLGELAAVLWLAMREGSPIRQPSGLRRARQAWAQETPEERRAIAADAAGELGIPGPRAPAEVLS